MLRGRLAAACSSPATSSFNCAASFWICSALPEAAACSSAICWLTSSAGLGAASALRRVNAGFTTPMMVSRLPRTSFPTASQGTGMDDLCG